MSRLLRVCVTTGAVISTLFVSAVALAAPDAALHGPAGVIHAPPDPASAFARRLYHHKSEHHRPGFAADGSQGIHGEAGDQISPFAANFESISDGDWSLKHQDITVSVDPTAAKLSAELTVTVAFHKDGLEDIQFRFGLADTVEVRSEAGELLKAKYTTYFNQMGQLTVTLPEASTATSSMKVRIKYERVMQCNTNKSPLKFCNFDNNIWSVMFYRYYMAHGSAYHAPFTSDLHVITPVGRVAAAPGTPSGPDKLGDDKLIWHFTQKERTANGGFAIGKYSVVGDKDVSAQIAADKPFVRMYVLKNYVFAATSLVGAAKDIISFYGQRFGAFPWAGINITQLAKNFGGGYAPLSGTFMSQNVFGAKVGGQGYTGFTELTAHELAHQWWGNLTAPMGSADVSLSESLAEFSSCYFTEKHLKNRSQIISDNLSYVYTVPANQDRAMQASNVYGSSKYVQIIYHKGAVVFDMLRRELGDEEMFKGLTKYAADYNRDYARVIDLQVAMEQSSGRKLGWFFEQWWKRKGGINIELSGRVDPIAGGGWMAKLRIKQLTTKPFRFKLPVRVTYADGTTEDRIEEVAAGDGLTIVSFKVDKPVRSLRPDISRHLLRRFQILTPGDVTLDGLVDGMDLMETAFRTNRAVFYNNYFYPNQLWDELFDSKPSHRIDADDVDVVVTNAGGQAVEF